MASDTAKNHIADRVKKTFTCSASHEMRDGQSSKEDVHLEVTLH